MTPYIYNLEFPDYVKELNLGGYVFKRVPNYETALLGLQHRISVLHEFNIRLSNGAHQLTAIVDFPEEEVRAILPWATEGNFTKLQDVLLLLTLFIGRNVFALSEAERALVFRPDPREHFYGQEFRLSIPSKDRWRNRNTGEVLNEAQMQGIPLFDYDHFDAGLEDTLNEVLETIASNDWKHEYENGYCLFLFRQAMLQNGIEAAFMLCWTIWEHLFTLHKKGELTERQIYSTNGEVKIGFVLERYLGVQLDDTSRQVIARLTRGRNRLVHYGIKPDNVLIEEMNLFVRLTERVMALILGLQPSNALNTMEHLDSFLRAG